jgi:hypothetical protein
MRPNVRFEVFTAVTMMNSVFWDVTSCGSCNNLQEPHGVTSQKTPFFMYIHVHYIELDRIFSTDMTLHSARQERPAHVPREIGRRPKRKVKIIKSRQD